MINRSLITIFIVFGWGIASQAQYYVRGQDPASLRWKQINTENFRVIFPEDYAERAAYIADVLEFSYEPASASLGHRPRRVPVILHNQTVVPNGFVSWAPARIEMFTNPPPGDGVHNWHERLAIHEFRHVVQVDKMNQGITRALSFLFGQQATGAIFGIFIPLWLLEGDAVAIETALTHGGRGREPDFEQGLRAQWLQKGAFNVDKAMLGSYKDHVPNYYELGYQMVASARYSYGVDIWDKVFDHIARRPYTIFPLAFGLKKYTGHNVKGLYHHTVEILDSAWTAQKEKHSYTGYRQINAAQPLFTNYRSLTFLNDSTLLAAKTGLEDIPRVVSIDPDGEEERLFTPGFYNSEVFSIGGGLLGWSELRNDPRWGHRSWSEIHTYDLETGDKQRITRRTRFFSPAVSPDGSQIAVTEVTDLDKYALVVVDSHTGEEVLRAAAPRNAYLMQPQWHPGGHTIIAIAQDEAGKRIVAYDKQSGTYSDLFHAGHTDIARPRYIGDEQIVFTGAFSGIDHIYLLETASGEVFQLVSSRFGAIDAVLSPNGQWLAWSDYSADGYRAVQHKGGLPALKPLDAVEDHSVGFHNMLADQEGAVISESAVPRKEREVKRYHKGLNLFNIHSWGPIALNVDTREVNPGLSLLSQNALSTSIAELGYEYDINEELGKFFVRYSYLGLYPVIDITAESGLRRAFYRYEDKPDEWHPFLWRENSVDLGVSMPLRFRRGPVSYGLTPVVRPGIKKVARTGDSPDFFLENEVYTMAYRLTAFRQHRMVMRDMAPRFAQLIDLNYRHTPFGGTDMGSARGARMIFYFPGVIRHHSFRLSAAYQEQETGTPKEQSMNYLFPNLINYPRGISGRYDKRTYSFSADYSFPLAYPEWNIPSVLYIKRFTLNFFGDYARATRRITPEEGDPFTTDEDLYSLGADFMSDIHVLRSFSPMGLGLRTIYLPQEERFEFRLLFVFDI